MNTDILFLTLVSFGRNYIKKSRNFEHKMFNSMWISPKATTFLGTKKFEISGFCCGADEYSSLLVTQYGLVGSYRRFQGNTVSSIFKVEQSKTSALLEPPDPETMLFQNVSTYFPGHVV